MEKYYALLMDIIESRKLSDDERFEAQKKLHTATQIVNQYFQNHMVKSLYFFGGDSLQGLFDDMASAYRAFQFIKHAIFPYTIRGSIGYDRLNEQIKEEFIDDNSNIFDGRAYHLAKNAIDFARESKKNVMIATKRSHDALFNVLINGYDLIPKTLSRTAVYSLMHLLSPLNGEKEWNCLEYFQEISFLVTGIANYYRAQSRAKNMENEHEMFLEEKEVTIQLEQYFKHVTPIKRVTDLLAEQQSTITKEMREILVYLLGTSEQNVNHMIRISHMNDLRKNEIAMTELINKFYREEK